MQEGFNKPSKAEVFRARLTSTIILWALVTGVFVSQNAWAFFGLVSFLTIAGAWEFRNLFSTLNYENYQLCHSIDIFA